MSAAEIADKEVIPADISGETSTSTAAFSSSESVLVPTQASTHQVVQFSSGNPRIEETRGIMYLFPQGDDDPSNLPHMLEMRIVRSDGVEDQYSVLIKFDAQSSADNFFKHFNRRRFSSLEVDICQIQYTVDVQYTGSIEHSQGSLASPAEEHSCPVCLERLDQDASGILTTICNHSFHCSCISKWADSSCPVCRYCQQQHEKSTCSVCGTSENLWICVICGNVGCGRYKEGHAIKHWKETQHCYSSEVETQRVWDYVGDNYVHRLIQSKTDGKLVELNFHCTYASHASGNCQCSADSGIEEALFNSKFDAIVAEYNDLLTSQLENQRKYFEAQLQEVKDETEKEISGAVDKAVKFKLQKLQTKLDKCVEEKKFHDDINENLIKNQEMWTTKIRQIEEREQAAVRKKDKKIQVLEEQLGDLMVKIEGGGSTVAEGGENTCDDIKEGAVLPVLASAAAAAAATVSSPSKKSSSSSSKHGSRQRKR